MKKLLLFLFALALGVSSLQHANAQVSVTATAGTVGPTSYATVNAAFAAINLGTHQGGVTISVTGNTTEPAVSVPLLKSASPSSYSSVLIVPSGGDWTINSAAAPTASRGVLELYGADNVTINGDPASTGTRHLSIVVATNASTGTAAVRFASNSATGLDGADNCTIKNCIITGGRNSATSTTVSYGFVMSNSSAISTGAYSSLNTRVENNLITRAFHGVYASGVSATYLNTGTQILNNTIGSATSALNIGSRGILITYSASTAGTGSATISGNDIRVGDYGATGYSTTIAGIEIGTVNAGCIVSKNNIHDINQPNTGGYGAHGIYVTGATSNAGISINNNFIRDCKMVVYQTSATSTFIPTGIFFTAGATLVKINYNSIAMGTQLGSGLNYSSFAVNASVSGVTITEFQDNIIVNTHASTYAYGLYCVATTNISAGTINYNDYYCPGGNVGYYNLLARTALAAWQTATGKDGNSISADPSFISATNLHINLGSTTVNNVGTPVAGITTDFDGNTRNATTPDIGADEYTPLVCTGAAGGAISPAIVNLCVGLTYNMSTTGSEVGAGVSYQWEVSTVGGGLGFGNVSGGSGANTTSYTTGALVAGTYYYRLKVTCSFGGAIGTSNELTLTVNTLPSVSVLPISGFYCTPGGSPVELTASGASTYAWSPASGLDFTNVAVVHASPGSTTTYTVTGTDANGCKNTATSVITVAEKPSLIGPNATPTSVCMDGSSQLLVNAVNTTAYTVAANTLSPVSTVGLTPGTYTIAPVGDDAVSNSVPIGFNFGFYGNYYTTFQVSTNGNIQFGGSASNAWTPAAIPAAAVPNNYIALAWKDWTTVSAGEINYYTSGNSPNRICIVDFNDAGNYVGQIILHEGSNVIDVIATNIGLNTSVQGLENISGTAGLASPGRNNVSWSSTTVSSYTFSPSGGTATYAWTPTTFLNDPSLPNPLASGINATTVYSVTGTIGGCSSTGTVTVSLGDPIACTNITNTPSCDNLNFNLTAHTTGGGGAFSYTWNDGIGGVYPDAQTITANLPVGIYTFSVDITDGCGTTCSMNKEVTVGTGPGGTASGPSTGLTYVGMTFAVTGHEAGSTFQWQVSTTNCSTGFSGIGGATSDVVLLTASTAGTFYINCIVTGSNGCVSTTNCVTTVVSVNGDNVCSAIPISIGLSGPFTNVGSTVEAGEPSPPGTGFTTQTGWGTGQVANNTVWFSFVAPASGRVSIGNNSNFNQWDNQFALYSMEDCAGFMGNYLIAANDDSTTGSAPYKAWIAPVCLTPGATYYLQVDGYGTGTNSFWGIRLKDEGNAAPVISGCPSNISVPVNAAGCTANVSWTAPTASDPDNCLTPLSFTSNFAPGANFPLGTTTVTYTANDGVNPPVTCSFTVTVVVNPIVVNITGNLAICNGSSTVLDAGAFSGYLWSTGETTRTITVSSASTWGVTVTDGFGCKASTSASTTVLPLPDISLLVFGTNSICSGSGVTITVAASVIGTNYQLRNDADNSPIGQPVAGDGGTISLPTGNLSSSTTFNVLATIVATGCSAQLTGEITVTVGGPVTTVSDAYICEGTTTVDVPVTVSAFSNVGSLSLTFGYTDTELTNPTIISRNAAFEGQWDPFEVTTLPAGIFKVSGYGALPGNGVSLGTDETMFTLRFNVVPGTAISAITLNENAQGTACEYAGVAPDYTTFCDTPTPDFYVNGDVTVYPLVTVNNPGDQLLCNGSLTTGVSFFSINYEGGVTYEWTNSEPGIGLAAAGTGDIAAFTAVNTGTAPVVAEIVVTPTNYGYITCPGASETFYITVNPTGQVNDPADLVKCNGESASVAFTTNNTGGTTTYSWTNDTPEIGLPGTGTGNIDPFNVVNTGTSPLVATIVVTPAFPLFGGKEPAADCVGPTETFTITVYPTGQVIKPSNQVVCNGANTTDIIFGTNNTGGATTYTWTNNDPTIGLAADGSGDILAFAAINTGTAPVIATITVTPQFENCTGPAETFTITVNPTAEVHQPDNQVVCIGTSTSVTFDTYNTGGYTSYFWTNSEPGINLGTFGIGNIDAFNATNTGTSPLVADLYVTPTFTNDGVSCTGPTKQFSITVNPTGQVDAVSNQLLCNESPTADIIFTTINSGGNTTFAWTNDQPGIGLASAGSGDISSFNVVNTGTAPVVATIIVVPIFENEGVSCTGSEISFTITVNPTGQVNATGDQVVCNGSPVSGVSFTTNNTVGSTVFTWTNSAASIGLAASGTGNILGFTGINTGTAPVIATVTVTPHFTYGALTCDGPADIFTITVNPTGQVNDPADIVECNGTLTSVTFGTVNTVGVTTYTWTNTLPSIGIAASGTGNIGSFSAANITNSPVVATITVTPHFTYDLVTCDGPEQTFTITVNPTGQVNTVANQRLCNGVSTSAINFTTTNLVGVTTYTWVNTAPSIGLDASGTGNIASFTAVNNGTAPVVATVTVTSHFTYGSVTCDGNQEIFTITVNPTGQVNQPANQVVCNTNSVGVVFGTTNTGGTTIYLWSNNTPGIGLSATGSGDISFNAINVGTSPVTATITVTPTFYNPGPAKEALTGCAGPSKTFTITVNPTGQVNQPANQVLNNGDLTAAVLYGTVNTGGTTTFTWTNNTTSIGLAAAGTGDIAAFTAVNLGVSTVVATIVVTPSYSNGSVSCTGPAKTFTITVNPKPILVTHNQSICSPYRIDLTAPAVTAGSVYPPTTVLTYWRDAACTLPVPTPTAVGNGTYYIKATIPPGGWFDVKPVVVTINPLPVIYAGTGSGAYCSSVPGITVGLTGSQLGVSYTLWLGITQISPTTIAGTGGPISFGSIPPVAGHYWTLAENNTTHCQNRMYNCVNITLTPALPVSVTIVPSVNPSVADANVTFTATPVNGGVTPSYQWKVNGFNVAGGGSTYTYKPVNGDVVTCVLTSSESCVSGPATSNSVVMTVTGYHTGSITVTGTVGAETRCYNSLLTITVAGGGTSFIVNSGGNVTMIAGQNILFMPGAKVLAGGYLHGYISLTDHCGAKAPSIVNTATGEETLPAISQNVKFNIYPNPTTGNFTIEQTSGSTAEVVKVEIFGMRGDKVLSGQLTGEKKREFTISGFPTGLYFVKVVSGDQAETFKLIKIN